MKRTAAVGKGCGVHANVLLRQIAERRQSCPRESWISEGSLAQRSLAKSPVRHGSPRSRAARRGASRKIRLRVGGFFRRRRAVRFEEAGRQGLERRMNRLARPVQFRAISSRFDRLAQRCAQNGWIPVQTCTSRCKRSGKAGSRSANRAIQRDVDWQWRGKPARLVESHSHLPARAQASNRQNRESSASVETALLHLDARPAANRRKRSATSPSYSPAGAFNGTP